MSTDIIETRGETLPDQEEVADELDRLMAQGETSMLNEVARKAAAYQEYERRADATERANYFGRLKVMAEARIGCIDLELHPSRLAAPLVFDGKPVRAMMRKSWRTIGMGLRAGVLDRIMALVEERDGTIGTHAVQAEIRRTGAIWIWSEPLQRRYAELYESEGLTARDVEKKLGMSKGTLQGILRRPGGTSKKRLRMHRHLAIRLAHVLGVDESELRSAPMKSSQASPKRRRRRKRRALPGGRLDETYVLIRKALQELDRAVGTSGEWDADEAYMHLYEAEGIIGRALRKAPIKMGAR